MAKRKPTTPIQPFPSEINREHFSSWLSGFTDGEGCFRLWMQRYKLSGGRICLIPQAEFTLSLRCDDIAALELIRSFFGCGVIHIDSRYYTKFVSAPKASYRVVRDAHLTGMLIPHYDKYPLVAKKRHDYEIWRRGVLFRASVMARPRRYSPVACKGVRGRLQQWTPEEVEIFDALVNELKHERIFKAPVTIQSS